jgi:hypothetical protein
MLVSIFPTGSYSHGELRMAEDGPSRAEDRPSRAEDGPLRAEDGRSRSGSGAKWLRYRRIGIGWNGSRNRNFDCIERETSPSEVYEFVRALGGGGVRRTSRESLLS